MKRTKLPKLSHLQFAIIHFAWHGSLGRDIRAKLPIMSGPAFYQAMARLENSRLVRGMYVKADGRRERRYETTSLGQKAANRAINFYDETRRY